MLSFELMSDGKLVMLESLFAVFHQPMDDA